MAKLWDGATWRVQGAGGAFSPKGVERETVFRVLLDGADENCHVVVLGGTVCEFVGSGEDAIQ
jgi:hypothetical protein